MQIVTKSQFAGSLHLTSGRVSQLLKLGLPVQKDGKIDLEAASRWYKANVTPPAVKAKRPARQANTPLDEESFGEARRQREWKRLEKEGLELSRLRGEVLNTEEVRAAQTEHATAERDALLNWPARVAPDLAARFGVTERDTYIALDAEIRKFLTERSQQPT